MTTARRAILAEWVGGPHDGTYWSVVPHRPVTIVEPAPCQLSLTEGTPDPIADRFVRLVVTPKHTARGWRLYYADRKPER